MKTSFKTLILAFTLALGINANAADGVEVTVTNDFTIKVAYTNAIQGAHIYLEDAAGERLYNETAGEKANDIKTLNLEQLPQGTYFLVYEDQYAKSYTTLKKDYNSLDIVSDESKTIFKPNYRIDNSIVLISFTNPKEVKTTTRVYDESGAIIESLSNKSLVVKQALNLEELPSGTYTIGVQIGEDYFSKVITLE